MYDAKGNLTSIVYADASHEDWTYDTAGNPANWTNRRGQTVRYSYDASGRLTGKTFPDGAKHTYAYDTRGNLTNAATLDSQLSTLYATAYAYDTNDRLTNIVYPGDKFLAFAYDAAGRRASSLDQLGHLLTYRYDTAGRLETMTNELGQLVVRYAYDPAGRLELKTLGNGVFTTYTYDDAGQLLALTNAFPDAKPLSWFNYTYDSRGRRTSMDTHYGKWTYGYDDLGQLTRAVLASTDTNIANQDLLYEYDPLGNRIWTVENGVTNLYTSNAMNQYVRTADGRGQTTDYTFDLDGNLVREVGPNGTTTYEYNDDNRLVGVTTPHDHSQYGYDALGQRVNTTENGIATHFVIDPIGLGNLVGEYDQDANLITHYDHGVGLLGRTDAGGQSAYYTFDGIGNVHQLATLSRAVLNAYGYAPFGERILRADSIPNLFQFGGEFGVISTRQRLMFMRARHYDIPRGRFSSPDPTTVRL
jgi:YD repeat-containing protein